VTGLSARFDQLSQLSPEQTWIKVSSIAPPWICALLTVAIGWQLGRMVWMLYPTPAEAPAPALVGSAAGASASPSAPARSVNADRIANAHLFGEATAAAAPPPPQDLEDVPETQLNLKLKGTIAASVDQESMAIIAEGNGDEKVYEIGDAIPGGASIHAIRLDRVILERAGRLEELRLPRSDELAGTSRRTSSTRRQAPVARTATIRQAIEQSDIRLTDIIRPQPVFKDGRQQGYRVYPGRQRQQFGQLGLRPGDLVTQINGMALDDPARGMEIFRSLGDSSQVTVTVERNGQTEVLSLDTSQLNEDGAGGQQGDATE
jgi:general secretion pathway protein C